MALLSVQDLTVTIGSPPLLDRISLQIHTGDRLCLLGRNGAGKSTLLKIMAGFMESDGGSVSREKGLTTAYLEQGFPERLSGSAEQNAGGKGADALLTLFGVDPESAVETLSGGMLRRVLLARVLSSGADLLLLDEPTNHLDIETILRLEDYLLKKVRTLIFVTHDRALAARLATRTAEIDRGSLYCFDTGYEEFLRRREELLDAEERSREVFDRKLAEEEAWLRKGIRARRTRNEGRVKALLAMREEYSRRRGREGSVKMEIRRAERSGKLVMETTNLTFSYDPAGEPVVKDLTTAVLRGDRLGIAGPNGSGKTTLLKLLLGDLSPLSGTVRRGTRLEPLFLDQIRSALDPEKTVMENIADGADSVTINGRKKHIISYLKDFLFTPDRANSPVANLSGGERNRLLLARLFSRPSNLIVMDEPTNDLDLETLELLEELLADYQGTVLLVSHDRRFLDNVVTGCLVLTGGGRVVEYAGGYSDWADAMADKPLSPKTRSKKTIKPKGTESVKLTFRERQELENLPEAITDMEARRDVLHAELADPELYTDPSRSPGALTRELADLEKKLEKAYARWQELEEKEAASKKG